MDRAGVEAHPAMLRRDNATGTAHTTEDLDVPTFLRRQMD